MIMLKIRQTPVTIILIFKLAHELNTYEVIQYFKRQYASRNYLCLLLSDICIYILKEVSASESQHFHLTLFKQYKSLTHETKLKVAVNMEDPTCLLQTVRTLNDSMKIHNLSSA